MEKRLWNLYRWSASYVGFKFKLPKKDQGPSSSSERYTLCYSQVLQICACQQNLTNLSARCTKFGDKNCQLH